jgi:outer membrane protein OmpA-like peptidoglycan-associated protein
MIKPNFTLIAVAVFFTCACAHKQRNEPADPTGENTYTRAGVPDPLPQLLKETVLHYGYDDASLTHHDMVALRKLGETMKTQPWAAVRISGHCDERGTEEYNLALGQRRADAARAYLLALGVSPNAVETITFGEEAPLIDAATEEAYAENRRAAFDPQPLELFGLLTTEAQ